MSVQILSSINKHLIVFMMTVVCFVGAALGLNAYLQPQFEAEASLVANLGSKDEQIDNKYNEILANQMLTKTYEDVIQSMSIAKIVKDKLAASQTPSELLKKIQVKTDPGALILNIYARDSDPVQAVAIANGFAESFVTHSSTIMYQANVRVLDLAVLENSSDPVSPKKAFNIAICLFIGVFMGAIFALLLDMFKPVKKKDMRLSAQTTLSN